MAKEKVEKTAKAKGICVFVSDNGKRCAKEVQGRGLCGNHYQSALKIIKASKEGKVKSRKGKQITWDYLVTLGKAAEGNRQESQSYFLND